MEASGLSELTALLKMGGHSLSIRLLKRSALAALVAMAAATGPAWSQVQNGNFEGGWTQRPNGDCHGTGWLRWNNQLPPTQFSASGTASFWSMPGNTCTLQPGNNYQRIIGGAIKSSNFRGGIRQQVPVVAGTTYDLKFDVRFFSEGKGAGSVGIDTTGQIDDALLPSVIYTPVQDKDLWQTYQVRFTATTSNVGLFFRAQIPEANATVWMDVDNVSITPVTAANQTVNEILDGPHAIQVDDNTFRIEWTTSVASSSQVEFGPEAPNTHDAAVYPVVVSNPALTTNHSVLLTNLASQQLYHFRVVSAANGSRTVYSMDRTFMTPEPAIEFTNGGFELGDGSNATGWKKFGQVDGRIGAYPADGLATWFFGVKASEGSWFVGSAASYETKNGGVYQRIQAVPGVLYTASANVLTLAGRGDPYDAQVILGIDPSGGVNPDSPLVVWGPEAYSEGYPPYPPAWINTSVSATSTGNAITVFVRFVHKWALPFNLTAVDNVIVGFPASVPSIGAAKQLPQGTTVEITQPSVVTLVPVTETGFFYAQAADRSSGIRVEHNGMLPNVGDKITLQGRLGVNADGERVLTDTSYTVVGSGSAAPLNIGNLPFGGTGYVGTETAGLSNQGLLVRVYGKVKKVDFIDNYLIIDDGSGVDAADTAAGIKVIRSEAFPMEGDYVAVVGVVSSEIRNGKQIRVLRGRDGMFPEDFETLSF